MRAWNRLELGFTPPRCDCLDWHCFRWCCLDGRCSDFDWRCELTILNYCFGLIVSIAFLSTSFSQHHYMVSDGLNYNDAYRILMTVSVELSCLMCLVYFSLFRKVVPRISAAGCVFSVTAGAFWAVLSTHFDNPLHIAAAGAFIAATTAYTLLLFVIGKNQTTHQTHEWYSNAYKLLLLLCLVLVATFLGLYLSETSEDQSWLPEHLALIFFQVAQLVYFWNHSFTSPDTKYTFVYQGL